ncbi:hypothetical protein Y032_0150g2741 [Ancylostoma ceylanicum]|nr:hypothetical protein Y032_0150g2741 [Ancylostoma ceylanicum]
MLRLFITCALLCSGYVSCLLCNSERSSNVTELSDREDFITVEAQTCFAKAHYDLGSRRIFLVELYGLNVEEEPGCELGVHGDDGVVKATVTCNSHDNCNTVFLMAIELEKQAFKEDKRLSANAILRALRKAQASAVNRDYLRQSRTSLYIAATIMGLLIISSFAHFASIGPSFFTRMPRKRKNR